MNEEQALPQVQPPSHPKIFHKLIVVLITALTAVGLVIAFYGRGGLKTQKGQLVGVVTADGMIRYGELVLADSKAVILRDVFISRGYAPFQEEATGPVPTPSYQVDPEWAPDAGMNSGEPGTLVISRSQVLFMTSDVADFAVKAVRNWTPTPSSMPFPPPPTPPEEILVPVEEGEEVVEELPTPEETAIPTVIPTQIPTSTPVETPVITSTP